MEWVKISFFKKITEQLSGTTEKITSKFKYGLSKTKDVFINRMENLFQRFHKMDDDFYDELEEILISADVGVLTTNKLIAELKIESRKKNIEDINSFKSLIVEKISSLMQSDNRNDLILASEGLSIILVVGVNGVGKTTSIGKLAHHLKNNGRQVLLAAGDTFRAGAIDQLEEWAKRIGVDIIKQQPGADPAAVIYDAIQSAKHRNIDVLICDTAGRLQNKVNLMDELNKIFRVIQRENPQAPHEVLLVLDATTGQNALSQAKIFAEKAGLTGIILTKLDGTAKGGIVIAISQELQLPVKFIGLGEQKDDLLPFDSKQYVNALFNSWIELENSKPL